MMDRLYDIVADSSTVMLCDKELSLDDVKLVDDDGDGLLETEGDAETSGEGDTEFVTDVVPVTDRDALSSVEKVGESV